MKSTLTAVALSVTVLTFVGCGGGGGGGGGNTTSSPTSRTVSISWQPNREAAVNRGGGGYRVYYSQTNGFAPGSPGVNVTDVPYVSGTQAPLSANLELTSGTWYIRVAAYSALNPPGGSTGSESAPSVQTPVVVP